MAHSDRTGGASHQPTIGHGFQKHNHARCIDAALACAEQRCEQAQLHFTPIRKRVLELLLTEHKAMGAYDVLSHIAAEGLGTQPPVAYRALDFLVTHGFAHKIQRLNAFVACSQPGTEHSPAFMICRACSAVAETHTSATGGMLGRAAKETGFLIEQTVFEAEGICPRCQPLNPSDDTKA